MSMWFYEHANVVVAITNVGLLVVWAIYAHLFYRDYKRRHRPRIIIDQMSGRGTESTCVVTNMSKEWVYIECVFAAARTQEQEFAARVSEDQQVSSVEQDDGEIESVTRQGPLAPGGLIVAGTLDDLARRTVPQVPARQSLEALNSLEIRVVAKLSSEDRPIGARRCFAVDANGREMFRPDQEGTQHMLSRVEREDVTRWLDDITRIA